MNNILDQLQKPGESDHDFLMRRGWIKDKDLYNKGGYFDEFPKNALRIQALEDLPKVAAELTRFRSMFHGADEKPNCENRIIIVDRVTDWDSDNCKFIPTPDVLCHISESPYPAEHHFDEFVLGWCYEWEFSKYFLTALALSSLEGKK